MEDNAQKKVFIYVGETNPDFEREFAETARKQGASAVEFINVPKEAIAHPKVELELAAAEQVCKLYERRQVEIFELFKKSVNSIHIRVPRGLYELKTIHHLCDRIIHVPAHVLMLHLKDPIYSYVDNASLNRSMFESAVNCLYLLRDETGVAFSSLISKSIDDDIKREIEVLSWSKHANPAISKSVAFRTSKTIDKNGKQELLKACGLTQSPPPFPDIRRRCEQLGDRWKYLYVARYKELCSWSHVHMSQVFSSAATGVGGAAAPPYRSIWRGGL